MVQHTNAHWHTNPLGPKSPDTWCLVKAFYFHVGITVKTWNSLCSLPPRRSLVIAESGRWENMKGSQRRAIDSILRSQSNILINKERDCLAWEKHRRGLLFVCVCSAGRNDLLTQHCLFFDVYMIQAFFTQETLLCIPPQHNEGPTTKVLCQTFTYTYFCCVRLPIMHTCHIYMFWSLVVGNTGPVLMISIPITPSILLHWKTACWNQSKITHSHFSFNA